MENLTLSNGVKMPLEGFGVFQIPEPEICKQAVLDAIKNGYRLIDTAACYMNEEAVGAAIKEAIDSHLVTREELFITWPASQPGLALPASGSTSRRPCRAARRACPRPD